MKLSKISLFSIFLLAALLLNACGLVNNNPNPTKTTIAPVESTTTTSEGMLLPRDYKYLSFASGGRVAEVLVQAGDAVSAGQVLAKLGDREQVAAGITSAELELENAQQALDDLNRSADLVRANNWVALLEAKAALIAADRAWANVDTDAFQQKIDDADETSKTKKEDLKTANEDYDKYKDLSEDNTSRKQYKDKLDTAQKDYDEAVRKHDELVIQRDRARVGRDQANAALAEAQRKFDNTQNGPDSDQLALADARLANARAQLTAAQSRLDNLDLKAPFAGTIVDVNVVANEQVGTSTWAVLIADFSEWYVETDDLTELEVVDVSVGQSVTIKPDALAELSLVGKVVEIPQNYVDKGGDITYKVRILLEDEVDPRLRWGMTVEVAFVP